MTAQLLPRLIQKQQKKYTFPKIHSNLFCPLCIELKTHLEVENCSLVVFPLGILMIIWERNTKRVNF